MPNPEGENADFDQLDDLFDEDPLEADAPAIDDESSPKETDGKSKKKKRKVKAKKEKAPKKVKPKAASGNLLQTLRGASPYTVMLGLALLAILIAIFCLFEELYFEYDLDIKAESYKQQARLDPGVQLGPATTAATV